MKYLDYPELESLSRALTFESAECKVFTRIEAYSCKAVKKERQLFKALESQYINAASMSPPDYLDETLASPFGRLDHSSARKTLFLLIATLNGAFPDHDFTDVNPSDFRRETNSDSVLNSLGTTLLSLRSHSNAPRSFSSFPSSYDEKEAKGSHRSGPSSMAFSPATSPPTAGSINHPQLAAVLDDIMSIPDCEVFSFHPDAESDPHACAEPEEEGDDLNEDRYADDDDDDGAWSDGHGGLDTAMSTPRQQDDDDGIDAPMFDEDLMGTGFTPASSQFTSSQPTTPQTPSAASARARAGDLLSLRRKLAAKPVATSSVPSTSLSSNDSFSEDDDDDGGGLNGLLWATYAFFYNRKLKRILFVSVWSRRNGVNASYSFSPPSYPSMAYSQPIIGTFSLDDGDLDSPAPSPAKRAIAKSAAKSRRRRSMSSSPAPSALSPFPHATSSPIGRGRGGSSNLTSSRLVQPIRSMTINDALTQPPTSSSAPATSSSSKRTVDVGSAEAPRDQARKQRKVTSDAKSSGNPLAA